MSKDELVSVLLDRLDKFEDKIDMLNTRLAALETDQAIRQSDKVWIARYVKIVSVVSSICISTILAIVPRILWK
jgi:hypothetical protein